MRLAICLPLAVLMAGCSLAPAVQTPPPPVPARFPHQGAGPVDAATVAAADIGWKRMFGDPRLQRLIELALEHNRDLRLAALNVDALGAQYRIQRSSQWPGASLEASTSRERAGATGQGAPGAAAQAATSTRHAVGLGLSAFEIDLFGRLRSLSEAAFARYLASEQGRHAAQLTLVGAVADAYFAERLAQEQSRLAAQTLSDWQQSLQIARLRSQAGQRSGLDVAQAEGQVASAQADIEARQREQARAGNALQLLVGLPQWPDDLPDGLPLTQPAVLTRLPAGLPSQLLQVRPDIAQEEQRLRAAHADIGAARAALFPQLSLTASLGYASPALGSLFDAGSRTWRFTPQITQPLFQAGRLRAEVRLAEVRRSEAVAQYERAIQTAFREVADGLAGSATYERQVEAQSQVVDSAERRLALSGLRWRAGLDGRLEWLDAQRQLYAARQALLDLRRAELGNAVALYKALGGGLCDQGARRAPASLAEGRR
ncbi:efflux transporter outer membrane subunit [Acidovorax sp. Leaf160]|uniref:efflux transporter outer membrane subunit n=1 Tax=Acidovorax sp. Leaf160 TaxID=1736280 RepID=UPI0006F631C7|nr:efflux transporter outer membrane subunit [Acidovorax sp. Leaf160]KQR42800.1 RND transporter [Acidovorax sp. Leaf160]